MKPVNILIGYSMRSGSTLLQHLLDQHSQVTAYSDLSSLGVLAKVMLGGSLRGNCCVKPLDLFYLHGGAPIHRHFNRYVWIVRDPRDSYLSSLESGYAYLFWRPGRRVRGIDVGLLFRWKRIHRFFFRHRSLWHLIRYEDMVREPDRVLRDLFRYLDLPAERLLPFRRFRLRNGGDYKIRQSTTLDTASLGRHRREFGGEQRRVFRDHIGREMAAFGYT